MKRAFVAVLLVVLLAAPADAFSVKTPLRKAGHGLKVAAKKVGKAIVYVAAGLAVIEFCMHTECDF